MSVTLFPASYQDYRYTQASDSDDAGIGLIRGEGYGSESDMPYGPLRFEDLAFFWEAVCEFCDLWYYGAAGWYAPDSSSSADVEIGWPGRRAWPSPSVNPLYSATGRELARRPWDMSPGGPFTATSRWQRIDPPLQLSGDLGWSGLDEWYTTDGTVRFLHGSLTQKSHASSEHLITAPEFSGALLGTGRTPERSLSSLFWGDLSAYRPGDVDVAKLRVPSSALIAKLYAAVRELGTLWFAASDATVVFAEGSYRKWRYDRYYVMPDSGQVPYPSEDFSGPFELYESGSPAWETEPIGSASSISSQGLGELSGHILYAFHGRRDRVRTYREWWSNPEDLHDRDKRTVLASEVGDQYWNCDAYSASYNVQINLGKVVDLEAMTGRSIGEGGQAAAVEDYKVFALVASVTHKSADVGDEAGSGSGASALGSDIEESESDSGTDYIVRRRICDVTSKFSVVRRGGRQWLKAVFGPSDTMLVGGRYGSVPAPPDPVAADPSDPLPEGRSMSLTTTAHRDSVTQLQAVFAFLKPRLRTKFTREAG